MGSRGPALHGRMQAFVYAGVQDERGQTRAGRRASRPRGARRGLHADEHVPVRRYRSEGILGLMNGRNAPAPAGPVPTAGDDVEELRRQVEALRLENAVMRETIIVCLCSM